jgi:putative transposon-encoded protein
LGENRGKDMAAKKRNKNSTGSLNSAREGLFNTPKAKFEVFGEEMIEKEVKQSGNSGRVYLPPEWVGRHVKIIRID